MTPDEALTREAMSIEPFEFRHVLGHWGSGVAIVATLTRSGRPCGLTANAVASVSLSPPLVLACLEHGADTHAALRHAGVFSINMLKQDDEQLARRFAGDDTPGKFLDVPHRAGASGAPILEDALAWVDCRLHAMHEAGDHTIFVGEVIAGAVNGGEPLLFYRGGYRRLSQ